MSDRDYHDGWADGKAGRDPDSARCALGANRVNDYEAGYIDSGLSDVPQRPPVPAAASSGVQQEGAET